MGQRTKISWCDSTWNPVTGCLHGCEYCYARRIAERFSAEEKNKTYFGEWKNCFNGNPKEIENPVHVSADLVRVSLERDAAINDLNLTRDCDTCKSKVEPYDIAYDMCDKCDINRMNTRRISYCCRGVCKENSGGTV